MTDVATLDLVVHHYNKIPGTNAMRLVKVNPYVRLACGRMPPLFLQGGRIFSEGGPEVVTLPEWFGEEIAKLSPAALREVGFGDDIGVSKPAADPDLYTCPETTCGQVVPLRQKGLHIARHRRAPKG